MQVVVCVKRRILASCVTDTVLAAAADKLIFVRQVILKLHQCCVVMLGEVGQV